MHNSSGGAAAAFHEPAHEPSANRGNITIPRTKGQGKIHWRGPPPARTMPAMKVDPRFLKADGQEVFTGNELLVKGCLETPGGVHMIGGYPGSPIAGYFDALAHIKDLLLEKGIRAVINNNEALSAAALNGTQLIPCRGMIAMKSVGVHVAADALALGNLAGANPKGGAIVVCGDDPWSDSTQVAADSRFLCKHLHMPVVEPSDPQEVKDFVAKSFQISALSELYIGYVLTTNLADGGGTVQCAPNHYPDASMRRQVELNTQGINLDKHVLLPPRTWWQEESLPIRHRKAADLARELGLNRILYGKSKPSPIGFVTSGLAHGYLLQALADMGMLGEYPILKFGLSYPVDSQIVREFAQQTQRMIVIEERRSFLEEQISEILLKDRQQGLGANVEVWGKKMPFGLSGVPASRGLHPSMLIEMLVGLLKRLEPAGDGAISSDATKAMQREIRTIDDTSRAKVEPLIPRTATFCPGCPHRDSANVCLQIKQQFADEKYMRRVHRRGAVDLVFHGDTGCYTMLMFPPNEPLMHDYSGMGLGGGTGSGIDPFITNKQVVFMGDSTFFHSGQIAISQAIKLGQDITFIILDNRTTAMTGHQPTPGVDYDVLGNPTAVQDIEEIVRGIAGSSGASIARVDPEKRQQYRRLLERTFLDEGVKIVIADKECGITRMRRQRRQERTIVKEKGFLPSWEHMNINVDICRFCLSCAELTGCPGLRHVETDYGPKMDTDTTWCVNDGACQRVGACDSFERVIIKRKRPVRIRMPELDLENIPEPQKRTIDDVWRCCLVGWGGLGIGVATSIIVRAGHKEGYDVVFLDKKGLAIRNGGVISQIVYNPSRRPLTPVIPYGKADLLLGIDILEAARALDPNGRTRIACRDRTAAVINTDKVQTIRGLMGREDFDPEALENLIRSHTREDDFLARNIGRICQKYLGTKLYANIMMLGFAFQKGLIPVSMHSMAWAIKDTIRTDIRKNLYAFNMGRQLVVRQDLFQGPPVRTEWREVLEDKCRHTIRRYRNGQAMADELRQIAAGAANAMPDLDESLRKALVVRIYDCMRWGGMPYARRYAQAVRDVYAKDSPSKGFAATQAVIHNLASAMLIKDAVFKAELATSPEKYARDREKYSVNPANGDRILYRRLWRPSFLFFGKQISFDMTVYDWMLALLKRSYWLRKAFPRWHGAQRRFRNEYEQAVTLFATGAVDYDQGLALLSGSACMDCMNPTCSIRGCPLDSQPPVWIALAVEGKWKQACDALHEHNNFPEFTSLICPAPCQSACKRSHMGYPVAVQRVEASIIDRAFEEGYVAPKPAARKTGRSVAVVGSGPAGLAAAQQLARAGHDVTVFEKEALPGGLLRYGIPAFRLDKSLIDRRLEQLKAEGVEFKTNHVIGRDTPAEDLLCRFDAVLLATGATKGRDLNVPGRDKQGVIFALDYLRRCNEQTQNSIDVRDKIVAVIGGGLTGEDCVETSLLRGAREVHQFEIMPRPKTQPHAAVDHGEALTRRWCVATRGFGGEDHIQELHAVQVQWQGAGKMSELPQSDFRMKIDLAVLAMGFDSVVDADIARGLGLEVDSRGGIVARDFATSVPGVFVAGDIAEGASFVATAINSGRQAAARIIKHLEA